MTIATNRKIHFRPLGEIKPRTMRQGVFALLATVLLFAFPEASRAGSGVYLSQEDFLSASFPKGVPEIQALWITGDLKEQVKQALGHDLGRLRLRYWDDNERTAWILEEIGKEELITLGITISEGQIDQVRVLVYRENRGWEVRLPFFTRQFVGIKLEDDQSLSKPIDGISGATLSVRALKRLAKVALLLDQQAQAEKTNG